MERISTLSNQISSSNSILCTYGQNGQLLIQLNKPKSLNSLDVEMFHQLAAKAQEKQIKIIIIRGVGSKAFSGGGDVKSLFKFLYEKDEHSALNYFNEEFQMDLSYFFFNQMNSTVHIAIFNGISIGGSLPMNLEAKIKVCTETASISIPESKNGLMIPGVHLFAHMNHNFGVYMAMTGDFIKGEDCVKCGLADYFVPNENLEAMQNELLQQVDLQSCKNVVEKYSKKINNLKHDYQDYIEFLFELTQFEQFWTILNNASAQQDDLRLSQFASHCLKQIKSCSQIATRANYQLLLESKKYNSQVESYIQQFNAQFNLTQFSNDCIEGLKRAVVLKSHIPKWQHSSPLEVEKELIDKIFNQENHMKYIINQSQKLSMIMKEKQESLIQMQ